MKKIRLLLLLLMSGVVNSQIVNIPDSVFKNVLLNGGGNNMFVDINSQSISDVDLNNDGEVQVSEAQNILSCSIDGNSITILSLEGIESFTNLNVLEMSQVDGLNFNLLPSMLPLGIEELAITSTSITQLDVTALLNLKTLRLVYCPTQSLLFSGLPNLENFYYYGIFYNYSGALASLDFSGSTSLKHIDCYMARLNNLNVSGCTNLEYLDCKNNFLTTLDVSGLTDLKYLNCSYNQISSALDFSATNAVENINCSNNNYSIPEIILHDKPNLQTLDISKNNIAELNLGYMPSLTSVKFNYNNLTSVDLSSCPQLTAIQMSDNPLTFVNLKNGNPQVPAINSYTYVYQSLTPLYICVDEEDIQSLINQIVEPQLPPYFNIGDYCTFTPGGDYNTITGTVTFDADGNGCTTSDAIFPFTSVQINDGTTTGTSLNSNGNYNFYTQAGTFTLTPQFENGWFTASPETVTFADNNNNTATQNFCVTANGVHNDAEVAIVPVLAARPGFDATYKIIYKNKGNQTLNGAVSLTYDDAVLDYVSASPVENSVATGSLSWNYSSLLPFESGEILLTLNVNSPMETPAVNNDDVLPFTIGITPNLGDETPADNTFALNQTVVGSYDPNDITCLEGATVHPDKIGNYLHYNINFENTGTYPASFVVVKDIIDETKFDVSSLVVLNASHAVEARLTGNKIEFYFGDINLAANGGKGNVAFKIKSLETLAVNSSVMQKADIFFDYNWPIVTNEAVATYAILNNTGFTKDASVKIFPNPATNVVSISADSAIQSMQLFDVQGRLLEATSVIDISTTLDISSRANGIYFIKIATDNGVNVEKLVKE